MGGSQRSQALPILLALLALLTPTIAARYTKTKDAIPLPSISALTFHAERETTHRRVPALPQLSCSGSGCQYYTPDSIRCTNSGSSYGSADIEWTCKASLPPEFKLGGTEVVCEGFDGPDDEWVLKGSCALEYRLMLTDAGSERFGSKGTGSDGSGGDGGNLGAFIGGAVFWVIFAGVLAWILWGLWNAVFRPEARRRGGRLGGGRGGDGGGWDDGDDDPPPPYSPYRDSPNSRPYRPRQPKQAQASSSRASSSRTAGGQQQQRPWWQSFGAGAAAGGAAGYYAANARSSARERDLRERERQMADRERPQGQRSWLQAMMGAGGTTRDVPRAQDRPVFSPQRPRSNGGGGSFGSPSPSFSSERHESTGFGGTRRR